MLDLNAEQVQGDLYYGRVVKDEFIVALLNSRLTKRERRLLLDTMIYAHTYGDVQSHLAGHSLKVLIGKLMDIMQVDRSIVEKTLGIKEEEEKSTEEIGIRATFDLSEFNESYHEYMDMLDEMTEKTEDFVLKQNRLFNINNVFNVS